MKKSRTLRLKRDFALSRANYAAWATDMAASVLPFFVSKESNQTPALAVGKSVGKKQRRALIRAFRKQRERVTITATIPRTGRCVAADLSVVKSSCAVCSQPAKELV